MHFFYIYYIFLSFCYFQKSLNLKKKKSLVNLTQSSPEEKHRYGFKGAVSDSLRRHRVWDAQSVLDQLCFHAGRLTPQYLQEFIRAHDDVNPGSVKAPVRIFFRTLLNLPYQHFLQTKKPSMSQTFVCSFKCSSNNIHHVVHRRCQMFLTGALTSDYYPFFAFLEREAMFLKPQ